MNTGFRPANILLPIGHNMKKWSVVACDQYTGQPEYWKSVENYVGDAPSTLHMILPEVYLDREDTAERISNINATMERYLNEKVMKNFADSLIYIERTLSCGLCRKGLVGALDLEQYDFSTGSQTLCRATEQTVASRIPPRQKVREGASVELPHVLVLIDDPEMTVIEGLTASKSELKKVYDFDLMQQGGHIKGYAVPKKLQDQVLEGLDALRIGAQKKYGSPLLYLVGDGNHSLATAKACYEKLKSEIGEEAEHSPARYALVELVNLQSDGIVFEPIHRVLYNVDKPAFFAALEKAHPGAMNGKGEQTVGLYEDGTEKTIGFARPTAKLTVGTLQQFLDEYLAAHPETTIDYIHEDAAVKECCEAENSLGFLLPAIEKNAFFESIIRDGVLPRKTFSMGESRDKRFYLECRKIK